VAIVFSFLRLQDFARSFSAQATTGDSLLFIWTALELNIIIVCACLPTLRDACLPIFCDSSSQDPFSRQSLENTNRAMSVQSPLGVRRSTPTPEFLDMDHLGPNTSLSDLPSGHIFVHTSLEQQVEQAHTARSDFVDVESLFARGTDEEKRMDKL
jgi:hypothetical protein